MSASEASFQTPYTRTPGSSTPGPDVTPKQGISEFWTFFWLAVANTTIITVAGVAAWLVVHRP